MTKSTISLKRRVEIGKAARVKAEAIFGDLNEPRTYRKLLDHERFLTVLLADLTEKIIPEGRQQESVPVARLGNQALEFGMHTGKRFDECPLDYLDWLCGEQLESFRKLRSYLRHPELKSHRKSEVVDG